MNKHADFHLVERLVVQNVRNKGFACATKDCTKPATRKAYCENCYRRFRRNGTTDHVVYQARKGEPIAFLARLTPSLNCIDWPFAKSGNGYGVILFDGLQTSASRACCVIHHGPPPTPSHQAAHSCGNGHLGCVNPAHLRWALPAENTADKFEHGTVQRGDDHPIAKISERDVRFIRQHYKSVGRQSLAKQFDLSPNHVWAISTGRAWRHVE